MILRLLAFLILLPTLAHAQQVILTTKEQQSLKALMGPTGELDQLILRETVAQSVPSTTGHVRIMATTAHGLVCSFNGGAYSSCLGGGGAPADAQYWVGAAHVDLSAEKNLGVLGTGLVINTAGVPSIFAGTSCTNQFPRSLNASAAATCASVSLANDITGTLGAASGGIGLNTSASSGIPSVNAGTWAVNNVLTTTRLLYAAPSNTVASSADLTWDNSGKILRVGGSPLITGPTPWIDITAPPYNASSGASAAANTVAIQAAHDAAPSTGARIYIPAAAACYSVNNEIAVTKPILWVGDGSGRADPGGTSGSCVRLTSATQNGFAVNTTEPNGFYNFSIVSSVASAGSAIRLDGGTVAGLSGNQKTVIVDMTFNGVNIGVKSVNAVFTRISRSTFWRPVTYGIEWENQNNPDQNGPSITDSTFYDDTFTAEAIVWRSGGGIRVVNNVILGFGNGVAVLPNTNTNTQEFLIVDNAITSFSGSGIIFQRASGTGINAYITIARNVITPLVSPGVGVGVHFPTSNATYVTDVKIIDNFISDVEQGVTIAGGARFRIQGNDFARITTGLATGIIFGGAATGVQIGDNRFTAVTNQRSAVTAEAWTIPNTVLVEGLQLASAGTAFSAGIGVPAGIAASYSFVLPVDDGLVGECLKTDGAGQTSWTSCTTPGSGITTLNGLTAGTQAFAKVDDTNVTLAIGSVTATHTFTMGWTGTLAVARGGSGAGTFTANGVLFGNGTSAFGVTAQGAANTVLTANAGAPVFSATPTVTTVTATGGATLGVASTTAGALTFKNATNAFNFILQSGVTVASVTFTLPTGDGAAGTCLSTNGSAILGWANCSSGGTGLTSLGGQTGATQTFGNDTNVQIVSATNVHTLTWAGTLAASRGGFGADMSAASGVISFNAGARVVNNVLGTAGKLLFAGGAGNTVLASGSAPLLTWDDALGHVSISNNASALPAPVAPTQVRQRWASASGVATSLEVDAYANQGELLFVRANGTPAVPTGLVADNPLGAVTGGGHDTATYRISAASLGFFSGGTWSGSSRPTYITFGTTPVGSTTNTEAVRITSAQRVGFGVTPKASVQLGTRFGLEGGNNTTNFTNNAYLDAGTWRYIATAAGTLYQGALGRQDFYTTPSGTADAAITWTSRLTILLTGEVGVGTETPGSKLTVAGVVESTTGGFKFPNASVQSTAACVESGTCAWANAHSWTKQDAITLLPFGASTGNTSEIRFNELAANGTNYVGFKAPDGIAVNVMWKLPTVDGTANQCLSTNGVQQLGWTGCAAGIAGSGAANQLTYWTGAAVQSGNNAFLVDVTNLGMALTKTALNVVPLHKMTATVTGSRAGLGSVLIPAMYGVTGPFAWTYSPAGSVIVSDTTSWTPPCSAVNTPPGCDATTNQGVSSSAFIVKHTFGAGYTSFGIAQAVYAETQRNSLATGLTDNDTYAFLPMMLDNNTVTSNVVSLYPYLTVNGTQAGFKAAMVAILSNHGNRQTDRHGISIGSGDVADTTTSFQAEAALNIYALSPNGAGAFTVESWQKAIKYVDRFNVLGDGRVVITPSVATTDQLAIASLAGDTNGANIKLTHTSEATRPNIFLRSNSGHFEIYDTTYANELLSVSHGALILSNESNVVFLVNNGAVVARTIKISAANGCGVGFRCLLIDN